MPDSSITFVGDYNYQPDPSYTDAMGATLPNDTSYDPLEIEKMKAALEAKKQMSIHEMGSNFLNNAKNVAAPVQKLIDQTGITAPAETIATLATGYPAALLHGFGSSSTDPETRKQLLELSQRVQYEPSSPMAQQALGMMADVQKELMIPPYTPGIGLRAGTQRTFTPADMQVLGARGINTAREIKAVPQDFNVGRQGFSVLNSIGEPTIGSKLGTFENKVIGEPQRQKLRKAASNVPEDVSYNALRQRVNESYEPGMPMFIVKGPSAKTWDIDAVKAAEDMESKNLPKPLINKVTGSWRGGENMWRQEISDDKASLVPKTFNDLQNFTGKRVTAPLKSFLDHPEFFAAYPDAKNIKVVVGPFGEEFRAAYSHPNNSIYINESEVAKGPRDVLKDLIHELTHHVQNVEGFERGANINEFPDDKDIIVAQELEEVMRLQKVPLQEAVRQYTIYNGSPPSLDAIEYAERGQGSIIRNPGKLARYGRVYGEAESESMEDRMDLTPEQRREHYPLEQQSFKDLIEEKPSYGIKFNPKNALIRKPGSSDFISAEQFKKQGFQHTPAVSDTDLPPDLEMAIKQKGGNWSDQRINDILSYLHLQVPAILRTSFTAEPVADWKNTAFGSGYSPREIDNFEKDFAINQWVDKRLKNYIKNDLGTPKDPVRDLADQGITHMQGLGERFATIDPNDRGLSVIGNIRTGEKLPAEGYATTNAGKEWEFQSDWDIDDLHLREWSEQNPTRFKNDIGLQKALAKDPDARIFAINTSMPTSLGFDHLIDELSAAVRSDSDLPQQLRITIKDLERMTVPDAVRLVSKINKYRADLAEKATVKNVAEFRQNFPALKTYDNGMAWHELREPVFDLPEGYEVRQNLYTVKDAITGEAEEAVRYNVYDDNGYATGNESYKPEGAIANYNRKKSYDTLDKALKEEGELMGHCVGGYTQDVVNGFSRIFTLRDAKGKPHVTIETQPSKGFEEDYSLRDSHHDVIQIKGKGNKEVSPKYRAEVFDFLNSAYPHSALVDVEDLRNINAVDMNASRIGKGDRIVNAIKAADPDLPRFISQEEFDALASQHYLHKHPEGYRDGGMVSSEPIESPPQFGVLPESFPSIEGEEAEALRQRLANIPAMNLNNPNYTQGLNTIIVKTPDHKSFQMTPDANKPAAYYDPARTGEVVIAPIIAKVSDYTSAPYVVGHEAQHLQDVESKAGKQNALDKLHMQRLQRQIESNFQKVKERYPEYANKGYYSQENVPFSERLADFAGYEAILPKGTRLVDTPFGKEVFNTPSLQNFYHQGVRPMEQKMMPQTPSVMERNPVISAAKEVKDFIRPKLDTFNAKINEGKSYADAVYETVLNKKDGGSIKSLEHDRMKFELMMRKR